MLKILNKQKAGGKKNHTFVMILNHAILTEAFGPALAIVRQYCGPFPQLQQDHGRYSLSTVGQKSPLLLAHSKNKIQHTSAVQ